MIKAINRDISILSKASRPAGIMDLGIAKNLEDTLSANSDFCVGMAANMIGELKRIIVFDSDRTYVTMFNPEIISCSGKYAVEEGCLSLSGVRKSARYRRITVKYQDKNFKWHEDEFEGFTAEIIQHEIDHCNGILI